MRIVALILLIPALAFTQTKYVSPTGSSGNSGTRESPWDFYTGMDDLNNTGSSTTILVLMDGVYSISNSTKEPWGKGTVRTRIMADAGAHPIVTRSNDYPPNLTFNNLTTVDGIWMGGLMEGSGVSSRSISTADSIIRCVFWDMYDDGLGGQKYPVVVRSCLFANIGRTIYDASTHGVYFTGTPSTQDSGIYVLRNVFVANGHGDTTGGYALHFYHGPTYVTANKNFVGKWGSLWAFDGNHATIRDNVFWSSQSSMGTGADTVSRYVYEDGLWQDYPAWGMVNGYTANLRYAHNLHGWIAYRQWFPSGGGCTADSNYWANSPMWDAAGDKPDLGTGTNTGVEYNYRTQVSGLLGLDSSQITGIVNTLARSLNNKTAAQVIADTANILSNWQQLLDVVDHWQGTTEEAVYGSGEPPAGPTPHVRWRK